MIRFAVMKGYLTILAGLYFCVYTPFTALCQQDSSLPEDQLTTHVINFSIQKGFLIPHYGLMDYYLKDKTLSIRLSIEKVVQGGWADSFSYATRGAEIYHTSLGNPKILGHSTHLISFGNLGIHSKGKGRLKFGGGIAFISKKFDLEKNIKNAAIGSSLNGAIAFEYQFPISLKRGFSLSPSLRFTHYSNGAYRLPNLGLNLFSMGLSLEKNRTHKSNSSKTEAPSLERKRLQAGLSIGRNQLIDPESQISNNYNLSLKYIQTDPSNFILGLGTDIHYSKSYRDYYTRNSNDVSSLGLLESTRAGLTGIVGISLGATEIHGNVGCYIYDHQKINGSLYQRIYVLTKLGKGFRLKFCLKSHNAKAETFELGITQDLWRK